MKLFFITGDDKVEVRATATDSDENPTVIGDYLDEIGPGEEAFGVPYEVLAEHKAGEVEVDEDGNYTISTEFDDEEDEDDDEEDDEDED